MDNNTALTISRALELLREKKISPQELTESCYRQIERLNPTLNAFITVIDPQDALTTQFRNGDADFSHALANIPIAIKDLFDIAGIRTTVGSKFFAEKVAQEDAFVVDKLKQAGAIFPGKTNTHEIALGITGNNPHYGTARNPWNTALIPGGSSSGSAIAVATGMALGALGTDTGGSIRIPASLCGVAGFKPTFGRVSLRGVFPLSWNLDHVGPLAKCVRDAALIFRLIAIYDPLDPACIKMPTDDYLRHLTDEVRGKKVALGVGEYIESSASEVLAALHEAAKVLESLGCKVQEENVDWMRDAAPANKTMTQSDGAAVHRNGLKAHPA